MPDCYVTSAWPILQSEGDLNAGPAIRFPSRKDQYTKAGSLALQDARLPCGKRMAYAAVGGRIGAEPAIRLSGREGQHTKIGTQTLQDARLLCDKRMAYAAVGGRIGAEPAIRFPSWKDQYTKTGPRLCRMPDCHATSAWPMLRSEGVWTLS